MQSLRSVFLLLGVCVLTTAAALGAMSLGSAASEQMAAKRRITEQFRQDLQDCEHHDADAAALCGRHAHAWAELARAELAGRLRGRYTDARAPRSGQSRPAS